MLRVEAENGWWLITHPDHAGLAADFAAHWGNELFPAPEPRQRVLHGIRAHDDGWAARDRHPSVTREGKPSAFSEELVGKYSAFEEIDLADYLSVRDRALDVITKEDPYAALLVAMHTHNLLTERADRSTIAADQLPLLDAFLERQKVRQASLRARLSLDETWTSETSLQTSIWNNFCLLQAMDNLSLYSCVGYRSQGSLLRSLPTTDGHSRIDVHPVEPRHFRLTPYPFDRPLLNFEVPARFVEGKRFVSAGALESSFQAATPVKLKITVTT